MRFTQQESYDGGTKSLKMMAYKLKRQMKKDHITKFKTGQEETITDKEQIVEEFINYDETLYRNEVKTESKLRHM